MIEIIMPYEPLVSVNRYKVPGKFFVLRQVSSWKVVLKHYIRQAEYQPIPPCEVGIEIIVFVGPGRLPDTENFRKVIHDAVAEALCCDDQQFVPWQEKSPPARHAMPGEEPGIIVRVREANHE